MKLTKGKIIAAVAVIAVLAGAFWYGGNAPGLQGWTVQEQESSAVLEAAPPASGPEESIAPIVTPGGEAESPPPTVSGSPVPSETPQETDALAPSPTPGGLDARPGGAEGGMTAREKVEAAAELAAPPPVWKRATRRTQRPTAWRSIRRLERTSILRIQCRKESLCRWSRRMWSSPM